MRFTDDDLRYFSSIKQNLKTVSDYAPVDEPVEPDRKGTLGALTTGIESTYTSLRSFWNAITGDTDEAETFASKTIGKTADQEAFESDLQARTKQTGDDFWNAAKNIYAAALENPAGAWHEMVSQLPNSGVALGSMATGAAAGSVAGPIGTLAGGIIGLFTGNYALETGGYLQQSAKGGLTDEESSEALTKGVQKAAGVTAFDVASMGLSKWIGGATRRATEGAIADTLKKAGVDIADPSAVKAALKDKALFAEATKAGQAAFEASSGVGARTARGTADALQQSFGEGAGEYSGSMLAEGKASATDAMLESVMSMPQSAMEIVGARGFDKPGILSKALAEADDQIRRNDELLKRGNTGNDAVIDQFAQGAASATDIFDLERQQGAQAQAGIARAGSVDEAIDQFAQASNAVNPLRATPVPTDINALNVPIAGNAPRTIQPPTFEQRNQQTIDRTFAPSLGLPPADEARQALIDAATTTPGFEAVPVEQRTARANQRILDRINPGFLSQGEPNGAIAANAASELVDTRSPVQVGDVGAGNRDTQPGADGGRGVGAVAGTPARSGETDQLSGIASAPTPAVASTSGAQAVTANKLPATPISTPPAVSLSGATENKPTEVARAPTAAAQPALSVEFNGIRYPVVAKVGKTPNSAEDVTVQNGTVFLGKFPAINAETGNEITVQSADFETVRDALKSGGAIATSQNVYNPNKGAAITAEKARIEAGRKRITPLADERIDAYRADIPRYVEGAGWAEVGGRLIRNADGDAVGRTVWVPKADWWVGKPEGVTESLLKKAAPKALAGEPMTAAEKNAIMWLLDVMEKDLTAQVSQEGEAIAEDLSDVADDIPGFDDAPPMSAAEAMRRSGLFTEEEINAETQGNAQAAGETAEGRAGEGIATGEGQADEAFALEQQTEAGLSERERIQAQSAKARAKAEAEAEAKAKADSERDSFGLTGSDRAADANAGQGDLLAPQANAEFTHAGYAIKPIKVMNGEAIEDRWNLQTEDNRLRALKGEREIGGDSLHKTREAAMLEAERQAARADQDRKDGEERRAREAAKQAEEQARIEANRGLSIVERKANSTLHKEIRLDGKVMTLREAVEMLVARGEELSTEEEPKIKPMSRRAFNRANNQEQAAHERRMKEAGNKTVYYIGGYDLGKTAYDYALTLQQGKESPTPLTKEADKESQPEYAGTFGSTDEVDNAVSGKPAGTWAIAIIGKNDLFNPDRPARHWVGYSLGGGQYSGGDMHNTLQEAVDSAIKAASERWDLDISAIKSHPAVQETQKPTDDAVRGSTQGDANNQATNTRYAKKIAEWDERAAKWGKSKIIEEARNAVAGNFLGREFNETAESFYARDEGARATRDWLHEQDGKGVSDELANARKTTTQQKPAEPEQAADAPFDSATWKEADKESQSALDAIEQSDSIPAADKIRLAADLREGRIKPEDVARMVGEKVEAEPEADTKQATIDDGKISDFGEKLGGARKDLAKAMAKEWTDDDIAGQPLSKIWPKSEVDAIDDTFIAAVAFAARSEIPTKPKKGYKVQSWVEKVKGLRAMTRMILDGAIEKETFAEKLKAWRGLEQFAAKVSLLENIDREQWGRIGAVAEYPDAYKYEDGNKVVTPIVNVEIDGRNARYSASSIADVIDQVREALGQEKVGKKMEFEVRGFAGSYFINKKGDPLYRKLKTFDTSNEALTFKARNYAELVQAWEAVKASDNVKETDVRNDENRPRTAKDWRNGKDVTPQQFIDDLGFRGVEFGNWVGQGKSAKERQGMLNEAYDALMDLAAIINVPPKAIALNGSLGLGFGSRGHGWASAHFEPDTLVINLTKTRGAGALAHEWFHALDNYFQRSRIEKGDVSRRLAGNHSGDFITYQPENYYVHKQSGTILPERAYKVMITGERHPVYGRILRESARDPAMWELKEGVRTEVGIAFADLVKALNDSPMRKRSELIDKGKSGGYWSRIIEVGARSFENYVIHKMMLNGYQNDYLANVKSVEDFARDPGRYPYLLEDEVAPVAEAFDNLFATIQTKETDTGTAMFSRKQPAFYSQLSRAIESAPDKVFTTASQFKLWLNSNAAKLGIKKDEIVWSGIDDFLDMQGKGKVSKADVVGFLSENGVRVEDVVLTEGDWAVYDGEENQYFETRSEAEEYATEQGINITEDTVFRGTNRSGGYGTKFSQYTPPGGIPGTYREILVTLPSKARSVAAIEAEWNDMPVSDPRWQSLSDERQRALGRGSFTSAHFDQKNILVHLRTDEVTGADGKRYLRVVEVQSDWGQQGKKQGFTDLAERKRIVDAIEKQHGFRIGPNTSIARLENAGVHPDLVSAWEREFLTKHSNTPTAPFVTDTKAWVSLGIKRAIQQAVSSGVDGIVFATGQQNADLYDLSKQVDYIDYVKSAPDRYNMAVVGKNGDEVFSENAITIDRVEEVVGKDVATKIANGEGKSGGGRMTLRGLDLKVGGEGMRKFYDEILPSVANDVLKKLGGGKVGAVDVAKAGREGKSVRAEDIARMKAEGLMTEQPGFIIPESLKAKVSGGLPLFARRIHGDRPTVNDYIVPETPEFDGNMSGDLAYTPQSAIVKGIEQLPIRLTVGIARSAHRGFGIQHMKTEGDSMKSRRPPEYTDDEAENYARHVATIARTFNEAYKEGRQLVLRSARLKEALVVSVQKDALTGEQFYSVESLRPAAKVVWGAPVWFTGRASLPGDRLLQSRASELSPDHESQQSDRLVQRNQTSKFDFTQQDPDRQPKNPVKVTIKKRRVFTQKDVDSFLRNGEDITPTTGEVLTDEAAQQDIRFLESAINKYHGGKKNAKGAYEAAPLPDAGLGIIARAFGARLRVFRVRGNAKDFGFFNGVYLSGNRDTVYVNESVQRPHLAVLGHELVHHLRKTNPKLYAKLAEHIRPYIKQEHYKAWSTLWEETGDKLEEEFMGEVMSDGFMDKTFWQAMAQKNRSLVRQIYTALAKLLNKAFGQYSPKTKDILSDYAEVMRIAGEVMAEAGMNPAETLKMAGVDEAMFSRADQQSKNSAVDKAIAAANKEIARQNEYDVQEELRSIEQGGNGADLSDIAEDPRYWDAENEEFTDAGYAEIGRRNLELAKERVERRQADELSDLNDAHQTVQAEAFAAYADALGLDSQVIYSGGGSRYVTFDIGDDAYKVRFADHFNTVRDSTMQSNFNVAPGRNDFTEAIDWLNKKAASPISSGVESETPNVGGMQERPAVRAETSGSLAEPAQKGGAGGKGNIADIRFSRKTEGFAVAESGKKDNLIYELQDKHIDLRRIIEGIRAAGGVVSDKWNAYMQEALYHGRAATRTENFLTDEMKPLIDRMKESGIGMAELNDYLHARHAKERNTVMAERNPDREGNEDLSGMSNEKADAVLKSARPEMAELAGMVDSMIATTRDMMVEYGLEKRETVDSWAGMYQSYVPLMREGFDKITGLGQGFSVRGPESKHATGSHRAVEEILAHVAMQREKIITRGEKNRVSLSLLGLVMLNPNKELWKVDKPTQIEQINPDTGLPEMVTGDYSDYQVPKKTVLINGIARQIIDPAYKGRPNVLNVKVNGEDRAVIFNEDNERALRLAESLKNLDVGDIGVVTSSVGHVTRYIASVNTQYNPVFGVINLMRDVQTGMLNLSSTDLKGKQGAVLHETMKALKGIYADARAVRNGKHPTSQYAKLWEQFKDTGGQTGYRDMFATGKERAKAIEHMLDPEWWAKTKLGRFATVNGLLAKPEQFMLDTLGKHVMHWLSDYNTAMENAVRLAAFKVGMENGMTAEKAAFTAKNLTVNFNKKGARTAQLGAWYAFFNASVQGTARIAETLGAGAKEGEVLGPVGKKIVLGGISIGAAQAVMLALAGFDEDEPPEFIRERALVIPAPGTDKGYVAIPMPLGFHILPNIGRKVMEAALYGKPLDKVADLFMTVLGGLNPVGGGASIAQTLSPTVTDPVVALSENKDWTGKAIYREAFSQNDPSPGFDRAKDSATGLARGIAYGLNLLSGGTDAVAGKLSPTPDQIDYLIGQATGGVGREVSKALTVADSFINQEDLPMYKVPLVGRLAGTASGPSANRDKFYDNIRMLNEHEAEIRYRKDNRQPVSGYLKENPEARLVKEANSLEYSIRELTKQKKAATANGQRERAKLLAERIDAKIARFNDRVAAASR